jgi:hypothetical protein
VEDRYYTVDGNIQLHGTEYQDKFGNPVYLIVLVNEATSKFELLELFFNASEFDTAWHKYAVSDTVADWGKA